VKKMQNLRTIFALVIYDCSCLHRLARGSRVTTCDVCYTSVNPSFREHRSVNIACMELYVSSKNRFFSVIGSRELGFGRKRYGQLSLATASFLLLLCMQA